MINFFNLSYLATGSAIQKKGLAAIQHSRVMEVLQEYDPVLAGTLPLDLFIEESDLDILCFASNLNSFEEKIRLSFGELSGFGVHSKIIGSEQSVIAGFQFEGFCFEIFAQPVPTREQTAYRHLINEHAILQSRGKDFREKIIALKRAGLKTEPAFAQLLQLEGDPYEAIFRHSY